MGKTLIWGFPLVLPRSALLLQHAAGSIRSSLFCADAAKSVREILRTVAQCHARNVLIRDVKPENFLYLTTDDDAPLKAIDFGMAQHCKPHESLRDKAGECSPNASQGFS